MNGNYYTLPKTCIIPWWKRLLLKVLPTYVATDYPTAIFYKVWRGTVYIVGEEQMPPLFGEVEESAPRYPEEAFRKDCEGISKLVADGTFHIHHAEPLPEQPPITVEDIEDAREAIDRINNESPPD